MKNTGLQIICVALLLLLPPAFAMTSVSRPLNTLGIDQTRITMLDGTVRTATLEGVGCSVSICSRTVIKGKTGPGSLVTTPLDTIATIKDITADQALFVLRNGTQQRLSLVPDFRVLYIPTPTGSSPQKLDLATIQSIEFAARAE